MSAPAIYLDYAATTPVAPEVAARMAECLTFEGTFGNAGSASHGFGAAASERVERARAEVATAVGAQPEEIIWTSGATEANNLAIFGATHYYREAGRHVVTARTEHKSVLDPCKELERRGWTVSYLSPDRDGVLEPQRVAAAIRPDTVLVSVMHVNNEIGTVNDIAAIAAACAAAGRPRFHVDAAQSVGKVTLDFAALGVDLMSLSAHKAYGPKGAGALVVSHRRAVHLTPLVYGGGQERSLRSGTLATHQAVGMGAAFALAGASLESDRVRIGTLSARLFGLIEPLGGVLRNGTHTVPHIVNLSFEGVEGESLLAAVRTELAVSTGSACTSAVQEPSYVLRALGRDDRLAESSLRFSLGRHTTQADVLRAAELVGGAVTRLRRIAGA
jgi:cysteine desulfurase